MDTHQHGKHKQRNIAKYINKINKANPDPSHNVYRLI